MAKPENSNTFKSDECVRLQGRRTWLIGVRSKLKITDEKKSLRARLKDIGVRVVKCHVFRLLIDNLKNSENIGGLDKVSKYKRTDGVDQERLENVCDSLRLGIYRYDNELALCISKIERKFSASLNDYETASENHDRTFILSERLRNEIIFLLKLRASPKMLVGGGDSITFRCIECYHNHQFIINEDSPLLDVWGYLEPMVRRGYKCKNCARKALPPRYDSLCEGRLRCPEDWKRDLWRQGISVIEYDVYLTHLLYPPFASFRCSGCGGKMPMPSPIPKVGDYSRGARYVMENAVCLECSKDCLISVPSIRGKMRAYFQYILELSKIKSEFSDKGESYDYWKKYLSTYEIENERVDFCLSIVFKELIQGKYSSNYNQHIAMGNIEIWFHESDFQINVRDLDKLSIYILGNDRFREMDSILREGMSAGCRFIDDERACLVRKREYRNLIPERSKRRLNLFGFDRCEYVDRLGDFLVSPLPEENKNIYMLD